MVGRREKDRLRPIFIAKLAVKFRAGVYPIRFMCLIHLPVVDFVDLYEFHVGKYTYIQYYTSIYTWIVLLQLVNETLDIHFSP